MLHSTFRSKPALIGCCNIFVSVLLCYIIIIVMNACSDFILFGIQTNTPTTNTGQPMYYRKTIQCQCISAVLGLRLLTFVPTNLNSTEFEKPQSHTFMNLGTNSLEIKGAFYSRPLVYTVATHCNEATP